MLLEAKERGLLARVGFFLCRDGQVPEAETIFSALAVSDPAKDGPVVGLALCQIIKGRFEQAIEQLDARLKRGGSPIEASLYLYKLTALGMAGRLAEARDLKTQMEAAGLTDAVQTADSLLAELEKRQC